MGLATVCEVAGVLGITPRRVQQLAREGMPREGRGKYDIEKCISWYEDFKQESLEEREAYEKARAERAHWQAQLAKLKYEVKSGKLVNADEVKVWAFNTGRAARDNLMNVPDRLAPLLVGEKDTHKVHMLLSEEIRRVCEDLSNNIRHLNLKQEMK